MQSSSSSSFFACQNAENLYLKRLKQIRSGIIAVMTFSLSITFLDSISAKDKNSLQLKLAESVLAFTVIALMIVNTKIANLQLKYEASEQSIEQASRLAKP